MSRKLCPQNETAPGAGSTVGGGEDRYHTGEDNEPFPSEFAAVVGQRRLGLNAGSITFGMVHHPRDTTEVSGMLSKRFSDTAA